jgi:hypothetical protein
MTDGCLPLSAPQKRSRRIAHGALGVVDPKMASTLLALALIQPTSTVLRLTPLSGCDSMRFARRRFSHSSGRFMQ